MKPIVCVIIFALFSINLWAQQSFSVTGSVKDENGIPLQLVTVFIDGSNKYTATDANGNYSFKNIEPGTYRVVTSMVGRGSERLMIILRDKPLNVNFVMKKTPIELNEVVIGSDFRRSEMLKIFINKFIGITKNAQSCTIINPKIIEFTTNKNVLLATTPDFLIIENKNLGYRIKYLVKIFRYDKNLNITSYTGDCIFEELSGTDEQKKKWAANRDEAYHGSFMHYLRSLYAGTSFQEGFSSLAFVDSAKTPTVSSENINMNNYVTRIDSNFIKLSFKQRLKVTYIPVSGIIVKRDAQQSEKEKALKLLQEYQDKARVGVVKLYLNYTLVDRNGNYLDYRSFLLEGVWNDLQVGDQLPFSYHPEVERNHILTEQ